MSGGEMNVTVDGEAFNAYCVDLDHTIRGGVNYSVTPTPVPVEGEWCAVNGLLNFEPNNGLDSAALQYAVWQTVYGTDVVNSAPADVQARADEYLAEVDGTCPLFCGETLGWAAEGAVDEDGVLTVYGTLSREEGPAVAGQEVFVTSDDGTFNQTGGFFTDADGGFVVTLDVTDATLPVTFSFATNGQEVVTFNGDPWNFQRLVSAIDTCEYDPAFSFFGEDGVGDPHTIGFWKHQARAKGRTHVSLDTLDSWLPLTVLGVTFETTDDLYDALWLKKASMEQRAVQQCLATRLNVASGELGWASPIDLGEGDAYTFAYWGEANVAFEAGDFETAKTICDTINNL